VGSLASRWDELELVQMGSTALQQLGCQGAWLLHDAGYDAQHQHIDGGSAACSEDIACSASTLELCKSDAYMRMQLGLRLYAMTCNGEQRLGCPVLIGGLVLVLACCLGGNLQWLGVM